MPTTPWRLPRPSPVPSSRHTDQNGCEPYIRENERLKDINADLYASCRELRDALAAACRVVAEHGDERLNRVFHAEMSRAGTRGGIGTRADAAIRKADGKAAD